ncbi:unnamed protein product [Calicophoron daubneyi]|uniref:Uncharacterized protein n=1 Tax=Calicophoron daubneyi TaxID=300641 RepID=A0AAV2TAD9_CALDB
MPSSVELAKPVIESIVDDPSVDVFTQRPRTPNRPRRPDVKQRTLVPPRPGVLFSCGTPIPQLRNFPKDRYTYLFKGENLYGKSPNLQYIGDVWSRYPDWDRRGSRLGAYYPWPPLKAGEKVAKHLKEESPSSLLGTELIRRPPTNLPGPVTMAFGRAAPGYYAKRFPNKETWFSSNVLHHRDPTWVYSLPKRTLEEYGVCDQHQIQYIKGLDETTEYQDRYLAHIPVENRWTTQKTAMTKKE